MASGPAPTIFHAKPIVDDGHISHKALEEACCECCYTPGKRPYCDRCIESKASERRERRKRLAG